MLMLGSEVPLLSIASREVGYEYCTCRFYYYYYYYYYYYNSWFCGTVVERWFWPANFPCPALGL